MMKELSLRLLAYERWANQRISSSLATIAKPPERAVEVMGHVLSVPEVWLGRIQSNPNPIGVWQNIPVVDMAELAEKQYQLFRTYLTGLPEAQFGELVTYHNTKGQRFQNTIFEILTHLSHHAMYHRGQVVQLIKPYLANIPSTDYIVWCRE